MKVKGSKEFDKKTGRDIIENLKKIVRKEGDCTGISCIDCIFSSNYAEDDESCGQNSILQLDESRTSPSANIRYTDTAKELLKELEGPARLKLNDSIILREEDIGMFIENLIKMYDKECCDTDVRCADCIFSSNYAEDGNGCGQNSIWNKNETRKNKKIESLLVKLISLKQRLS